MTAPSTTEQAGKNVARHDPYAALRLPEFRYYLAGNFLAILGMQMQTFAVRWELDDRTRMPLAVGLIGLMQCVPVLLLALPGGHVADRHDRKGIILWALPACGVCSLGLLLNSLSSGPIWVAYFWLFVNGAAQAFLRPAKAAFLPQLVSLDVFASAVMWTTGSFHLAMVIGPAIAGAVIAARGDAAWVYLLDALASTAFFLLLLRIRSRPVERPHVESSWRAIGAGVTFLRSQPVVLGAMTLDMFAVLLGSVVTLLPFYAREVLHAGPSGLGWLQAAQAIGAVAMSVVLAHRPPLGRAGSALLWSVGGFGAATIVFGFSTNFWLSWAMLFAAGALDYVSVVVRHTLVQVLTPDNMRGRVSAVNGLFIAASNELGGFESGLVAQLTSPVFSVVSGGCGTLAVVLATIWLFPALGRHGALTTKASSRPEEEEKTASSDA